MADPNPCNPGFKHPRPYNNPTTPQPKANACVNSAVADGKDRLIKSFHDTGMPGVGVHHNVEYISYIRVQPVNLDPNNPNCSCFCGCS
jgi:hypothetical protein